MSEHLCAREGCPDPAYMGNALYWQSPIGPLIIYVCAEHFAQYLRAPSPRQGQHPPAWVASDPICSRLWQRDADWRDNALLAGDNATTQRLLIKLAYKVSGGSEGEATEV